MRLVDAPRVATVHRLRPRSADACAAPAAGLPRQSRDCSNVIDLSGARKRRSQLPYFQPPEGTAA